MRAVVFLLAWLLCSPSLAQPTSHPCDCSQVIQKCRRIMAKAKAVIALQRARCKRDMDKMRANCDLQKRLSDIEQRKLRANIQTLTKALKGPPVLPWVLVGVAGAVAVAAGIWAGVEIARRVEVEGKLAIK